MSAGGSIPRLERIQIILQDLELSHLLLPCKEFSSKKKLRAGGNVLGLWPQQATGSSATTARAGFDHKACCSDVRHFRVMHRLCDTEDAEVAQAVALGVEWS